jgi:hypothetical protein
MAIVVEDGSVVTGANSYITLAEARAYGVLYGVTISAVDATAEVLSHKAVRYLEARRNQYQGTKVSVDQPLQWPRYDVVVDVLMY